MLEANSIERLDKDFDELEITPEDEEQILELSRDPAIYEKIIGSIAPSIYGYEDIKEALALQLFSGVVKNLPDGARIRGDIHMMLVGDPGIAKVSCCVMWLSFPQEGSLLQAKRICKRFDRSCRKGRHE